MINTEICSSYSLALQRKSFEDIVAGIHAKTEEIQFESCRGYFFGDLFAITTGRYGVDIPSEDFESSEGDFVRKKSAML